MKRRRVQIAGLIVVERIRVDHVARCHRIAINIIAVIVDAVFGGYAVYLLGFGRAKRAAIQPIIAIVAESTARSAPGRSVCRRARAVVVVM